MIPEFKQKQSSTFPGGSVVIQETWTNPWSEKIPQVTEQLSPRAPQALTLCSGGPEPKLLKPLGPRAATTKPFSGFSTREATAMRSPSPAAREKACTVTKTQHSQKIHYIFLKSLFSEARMSMCVLSHITRVQLFATPWTITCQALLSLGFSRQEYWSELPFPPQEEYRISSIYLYI